MASISFDLNHRTEIERGMPAEQARVRELQQEGVLDTLYVPESAGAPGGVWVVFNGDSRESVERVVASLPLYPHMRVELTQLRSLQVGA